MNNLAHTHRTPTRIVTVHLSRFRFGSPIIPDFEIGPYTIITLHHRGVRAYC